jgi:hypothetical protein
MTTTSQQLEALKGELNFIGREVQRIEVLRSDDFESVDAIAQSVQVALSILALEPELNPVVDHSLTGLPATRAQAPSRSA